MALYYYQGSVYWKLPQSLIKVKALGKIYLRKSILDYANGSKKYIYMI